MSKQRRSSATSASSAYSAAETPGSAEDDFESYVIIVFGASGDLAVKKTYPAMFRLFLAGLLPSQVHIVGFARNKKYEDLDVFRAHLATKLTGDSGHLGMRERFLSRCTYVPLFSLYITYALPFRLRYYSERDVYSVIDPVLLRFVYRIQTVSQHHKNSIGLPRTTKIFPPRPVLSSHVYVI